ncbi:chitin binding peritrophin-A domain-containing protein [Nocardia sp. NPDC049149]|uniref:chitin binding peritrophin-A domain-containing protein n=1 Tax=Nocardia sp. NPDC049149 TaxID=3364315 RepID=UPI0037162541
MAGFNIDDRTTWNWVNGGQVTCVRPWDEDEYHLNWQDKGSFYRCSEGVPYLQPCPPGMNFNPAIGTCDFPASSTEATIYDWAVKNGVVSPDQR